MRAVVWVALLALLSPGLAGCLGSDAADDDASEVASLPGSPASSVDDRANATVDDGSVPMNESLGHQPHVHDYWSGKERVTLMDDDVASDPFRTIAFTFLNAATGTPGVGGVIVELPDGAIVYEGAGKLELTATWTDATVTGVGVRYRSAASAEWSEIIPATQGIPLVIEITPEMSDMPHAKTSKWSFLLVPAQAGQVIAGAVHVRIDIVKMHDIDLFPGHPDLFNGAVTLPVFEGTGTTRQKNPALALADVVIAQGVPESGFPFSSVVPMETRTMTANITITSATTTVGEVQDVYLLVKPADTNEYAIAELVSSDPAAGLYQYAWLVEMQQADSPYAKESQWRFDLRVSVDPTSGALDAGCAGCFDAQVDFDAVIVAHVEALPDAKPLEGFRD